MRFFHYVLLLCVIANSACFLNDDKHFSLSADPDSQDLEPNTQMNADWQGSGTGSPSGTLPPQNEPGTGEIPPPAPSANPANPLSLPAPRIPGDRPLTIGQTPSNPGTGIRNSVNPAPAETNTPFTRRPAHVLCATAPLCIGRYFEPSAYERRTFQGNSFSGDRKEYFGSDETAVFLLQYGRADYTNHVRLNNLRVNVTLLRGTQIIQSVSANQPQTYKMELRVDLRNLAAGDYQLQARIEQVNAAGIVLSNLYTLSTPFVKSSRTETLQSFPQAGIPIQVHALNERQSGVWPISTGVPFPRGALENVNDLALLENGVKIPAQFINRATWSPNGSLKWVGVDFLAYFENGTPRNYQLVWRSEPTNPPMPTNLNYIQNENEITVSTGVARYLINRRQFAGIENAWIDLNRDGNFTDTEQALNGRGGPFVVDEAGQTYLPVANTTQVEVEEAGSTRVTVVAKGWYANSQGTQFCKFATRLSFFAGQPQALISHRTIITYDTRTNKRIRDVAWQFTPNEAGSQVIFGADGQSLSGAVPNRGNSLYLHQDRGSHFRLMNGASQVNEGRRADGWMSQNGTQVRSSIFLRDIYQKFPKEMEVNNDPNSPQVPSVDNVWKPKLTLHFWPKHGRVAFTEAESLDRANIYKDRFAHQGTMLDFNLPASYATRLREFHATAGPDLNWDSEDQIPAAIAGNAQGVAIGNEFLFVPQPAATSPENLLRSARLFQQSPHALASPTWIAQAEPDGKFAARDPAYFPALERHLDLAYPSYERYAIDATDEYGMWIFAGTHDNWTPGANQARLHRVWNSSHYQNVWAAWFLYLRGGQKDQYEWARVNSDHFRDVETINFAKPMSNTTTFPEGAMMHVKGFLPWAGEASIGNHFVDMSSNLLRYYITGDRHSLDLVNQWHQSMLDLIQSETAGRSNAYRSCTSAGQMTLRESMPVVAELAYLYEATWDPRLLQFISQSYSYLFDIPFECTVQAAIHPLIHSNWVHRYYNLTRDPRVVERLTAWTRAGYSNPMANSFLYRQTGERRYLEAVIPKMYDMAYQFYDNPADTNYHGFSTAEGASYALWMKEAPYLLQAMKDAGMTPAPGVQPMIYPSRPVAMTARFSGYRNARGWSPAGMITLISPQERQSFQIATESISGSSSNYFILNAFNEFRNSQLTGTISSNTSKVVNVNIPVNPNTDLYRFECSGTCDFRAPLTADLPEVAVMLRDQFQNGGMAPSTYASGQRQLFYVRPLDPNQPVTLLVDSELNRRWPSYVRLEDANGQLIQESSIMAGSTRPSVRLNLDPTKSPYPWRLYTVTAYSLQMRIDDARTPELFFSSDPDAFEEVLPLVNLP